MMLQAVLLASLATVSLASICCAPQQWTGFRASTTVGPTGVEILLQAYNYDALNQRYAFSGNYTPTFSNYKEIWDFPTKTGYRIDADRQTCERFAVTGTFPTQCIPSGAVELGPVSYGFLRDKITGVSYQFNDTSGGDFQTAVAVVTTDTCTPITSTITTLRPGSNSVTVTCFNNILPGIRDDSVFDPPVYCGMSSKIDVNNEIPTVGFKRAQSYL